jgi:glycerate dehydrogenase
MKIVVLDGYTVNPGDMSWDELKKLGDVTVYDQTTPDKLIERAKDAEILLSNKVVLGE